MTVWAGRRGMAWKKERCCSVDPAEPSGMQKTHMTVMGIPNQ
jgi:hypothetical protein